MNDCPAALTAVNHVEPVLRRCAIGHDELLVRNCRVWQLTRLGIPGPLAEVYADRIAWHQVARLMQRGGAARLALRIVR